VSGRTLLRQAVRSKSPDRLAIVDFLLQQGADCTAECWEPFKILQSIFYSDDESSETRSKENLVLFHRLLDQGVSAKSWKYESITEHLAGQRRLFGLREISQPPVLMSLINACAERSIISRTIMAGADPNEGGESDPPPLVSAASMGRLDLVEELLSAHSASVDARHDIWRPLRRVNSFEDSLSKSSADLRLAYPRFCTPLQAACNPKKGSISLKIVEYLIKRGASVNAPAGDEYTNRYTALQWAVFHGSLTVACYLLDHGADVNAPSAEEVMTSDFFLLRALDIAAFGGRMDMVQLLIDAKGRSGYPGISGIDGAAELATIAHHFGVLQLLEETAQKLGVLPPDYHFNIWDQF